MASPLVSILTRTLGRPCLADAAAAVAAQTYRPLEWVVVDASGRGVDVPAAGDVPVRVLSSGAPLPRAPAANFGFRHVRGARVAILDDDDLIRPAFVERLAATLDATPGAVVAYCDVDVDTGDAGLTGRYAFEYSELMLHLRNLFPPVAALFDAGVLRDGDVRIHEALDWFDDWDLWLQVAAHGTFAHVREPLAVYRLGLSQSGVWRHDEPDADPALAAHEEVVRARHAARRRELEAAHDARKARARALAAERRWPEAAQAWLDAHARFHYDPEPILGYAAIAALAGESAACVATLRAGLALMPRAVLLHRALADALARAGDAAGAAAALREAERWERAAGTPGR